MFGNFCPSFGGKIVYPRLPRSHRLNFCQVSYSVFRIAQSLFFWELIFCMFCYSYTGIGTNGIVPKECALKLNRRSFICLNDMIVSRFREAAFWVRCTVHWPYLCFRCGFKSINVQAFMGTQASTSSQILIKPTNK